VSIIKEDRKVRYGEAWVIAIAASAAATTALKVTVIERRETEELMVAPGLTVVPLGLHKLRSHA